MLFTANYPVYCTSFIRPPTPVAHLPGSCDCKGIVGISGVCDREIIDCSSSIVLRGPLAVRVRVGVAASSYAGSRVNADGGVRTG